MISKKFFILLSIILLVVTSIVTWYFSYRSGLAIAYSDAQSHLNIARSVVDNRQPGIAQLGTVWPPLNHVLFLLLIWNDWAWHSGFAGSFFSMLAYIFSVIGIYKIVNELTDNFIASIIGAISFALNLNIIYLQTTPLTEPLYLVFFIFSAFFLVKFIKTDRLCYLLLMGFFGILQILTRYDGWFVTLAQGLILIYHQKFVRKVNFQEALGKLLLFSMPIIFGASLWFLWNTLIFGDPLYFMFGPNSAHTQQAVIKDSVGLITKGNLRLSLITYWYAASDNVGNYFVALASLGIILFFVMKSKIGSLQTKLLVFLIFFAPILFNIVALYLGFSIINVPALHWKEVIQYFNVRYGIMALPFVAVFIGLLAEKARGKIIAILIILVIIFQSFVIYKQGIITIGDGVSGGSNGAGYTTVANLLEKNVKPGQSTLISATLYGSVIFKSGFPFKNFITEGASHEWKNALAQPQDSVDWVVMGNQNTNDIVYTTLFENNSQKFFKNYVNVYCDISICVYKKRTPVEMFMYADGTKLKVANDNFTVKGVNSYDLAYRPTSAIDATFNNLSSIGVNTVRFWMFGDGNADGFQPTSGIPNEARFENADYLIADASKYNIRLIPVLVNNWNDYGGEQQYLKWTGKNPNNQDAFYTDPETISLFKNYINHVIPRKNTVNGIPYNDDPTIMAWEVVNEPRFSTKNSQAFMNWFSDVASYIKQEDSNHMITMETDTASVSKTGQLSIKDYCGSLPVDFCTAHLYLYNNTTPIYSDLSTVKNNIQQYIQLADSNNKPFILGEVGVSKFTSPFNMQPLDVLKNILNFNNSSGTLIWNWSDKPDDSYGFSNSGYGERGDYNKNDLENIIK